MSTNTITRTPISQDEIELSLAALAECANENGLTPVRAKKGTHLTPPGNPPRRAGDEREEVLLGDPAPQDPRARALDRALDEGHHRLDDEGRRRGARRAPAQRGHRGAHHRGLAQAPQGERAVARREQEAHRRGRRPAEARLDARVELARARDAPLGGRGRLRAVH